MGYDMTIERTPPEEAARALDAQAAFHTAARRRDALRLSCDHPDYAAAQAEVERAYDAMYAVDTAYFRLNIWGMSRFRELMDQLGMVVSDYGVPPWPHEPEGVTWDEIDAAQNGNGASKSPARPEVVTYLKQCEAHVTWHPEPAFGMALHKFASNDGWLVTPEEIEAALVGYRTHAGSEVKVIVGDDVDYWLEWIAYLERAQHRGGFRVW
ncbi:hypothetical protein [Streptomyces sp. NPDC102360]|uniref:hypothetical protein n=1 Tax=Streptomyces sp. NPDC102360 TaxID=3366160 RepID=UPI003802A7B1